jgi:SAM-dependent methyltransferase
MSNYSKTFKLYGEYYDLIYNKKNYRREVDDITKLLKKFKFDKRNILEFGCGTGNHAKHFVKKGYKVHGIEKSKEMIALCKKINGFTYQQGDICKIKLKKKYDIIMSLFHVINYQINNQNLNNFFKNSKNHLNNNGILGFDFWYTPAVRFQKPMIKLSEIKNKKIKLIKLAEPTFLSKNKIVRVKYSIIIKNLLNNTINVIRENHLMKHFTYSELEKVFKKYGFECLHLRELSSNRKPSKHTWGVFCLLQKIKI